MLEMFAPQIYGRNGPGGAIDQPVVGVDQAGRGWASGFFYVARAKYEGQTRWNELKLYIII